MPSSLEAVSHKAGGTRSSNERSSAFEKALQADMPPDPEVMAVWDSLYDPSEHLIREVSAGAAYHSKVKNGQVVHPLRTSVFYAHGLIRSGNSQSIGRAADILSRIVELQETDPWSPFFGIWGYHLEEPPASMAPADFNWADFIGIHLLEILRMPDHRLPHNLVERLEATVRNAVLSIFRRNVEVSYTNIAIMGATVCLLAGELLGEDIWVEYGRNRLHAIRNLFERNAGFNEYNSPTYSLTALFELERVLRLVEDETSRIDAKVLWLGVWRDLAESYHPATGQLSGPQSRSYGNWLAEGQLRCLDQRLGFKLPRLAPTCESLSGCFEELVAPGPLPCPEEFRGHFVELPGPTVFKVQPRVRRADGIPCLLSSCWMSQRATLGSINQEICWAQVRPVLGYWKTGDSGLARLRVRFLHNGKDFASGLLISNQQDSTVLSAAQLILDGGTYHPHFDKPADGVFLTDELLVRIEVEGLNLHAKTTSSNSWWVGNESGGVSLCFGPSGFAGGSIFGTSMKTHGDLYIFDNVLYRGKTLSMSPKTMGETFASLLIHWSARPAAALIPEIATRGYEDRRVLEWQDAGKFLLLNLGRHPMERDGLVKILQS